MQGPRRRSWRKHDLRGEHTFGLPKETKEEEEAAPHMGGAKESDGQGDHLSQFSTFFQELR
jgi:hypothetical protein